MGEAMRLAVLLIMMMFPAALSRTIDKEACLGDSNQCVSFSYDPCTEALSFRGNMLQLSHSQTLQLSQLRGQGYNECTDVNIDKIRTLVNQINALSHTDIDDQAIRAFQPFGPQLCIVLSSQDIEPNQEEVRVHFKVSIHARNKAFGFRPPDMKLVERDESLGQSCRGRDATSCLSQPLCGMCGDTCVLGDSNGAWCSEQCSAWQHRDTSVQDDVSDRDDTTDREDMTVDSTAVDTYLSDLEKREEDSEASSRGHHGSGSGGDSTLAIVMVALSAVTVVVVGGMVGVWWYVRSRNGEKLRVRQLYLEGEDGYSGHHILVDQDPDMSSVTPRTAAVVVPSEPYPGA